MSPSDLTTQLVENHRQSLAFLRQQRVNARALAEDILQDAFVKSIEQPIGRRCDVAVTDPRELRVVGETLARRTPWRWAPRLYEARARVCRVLLSESACGT